MSKEISKRYAQRGVSASKEDVHAAIKNIDNYSKMDDIISARNQERFGTLFV